MEERSSASSYSVSEVLAKVKRELEGIEVLVQGEVSEVSNKPGYKAVYFTIKDEQASLRCLMWNSRYQRAGIELRVGMVVDVFGKFTVYAPKGQMNFDVMRIEPAGEGALRRKVAQLVEKLRQEGLTDSDRKRSLPELPLKIGLVTSPRGAAVHDVLRTLRRRYPMARVLLAGVPVEGAGASQAILNGLAATVEEGAEVVLVVRGGGSFEDLMPFNDEVLARAIAACPVPVVTGIGHEMDTSIADLVSDARATSPTAAAEMVAPSFEELTGHLVGAASKMSTSFGHRLALTSQSVRKIASRPVFTDPMVLLSRSMQAVDYAADRLSRALPGQVERSRVALSYARLSLVRSMPLLLDRCDLELGMRRERIVDKGQLIEKGYRPLIASRAARLHDLSPVAVLARGYSVTRDQHGTLVSRTSQVQRGDNVTVSLSDGSLICSVEDIQEPHKE